MKLKIKTEERKRRRTATSTERKKYAIVIAHCYGHIVKLTYHGPWTDIHIYMCVYLASLWTMVWHWLWLWLCVCVCNIRSIMYVNWKYIIIFVIFIVFKLLRADFQPKRVQVMCELYWPVIYRNLSTLLMLNFFSFFLFFAFLRSHFSPWCEATTWKHTYEAWRFSQEHHYHWNGGRMGGMRYKIHTSDQTRKRKTRNYWKIH